MVRYALLVACLFTLGDAQGLQAVTGRVWSVNQRPLGGVNVLVKGTSAATVTDMNGYFSLLLPEGHTVLLFMYTGQKSVEQPMVIRRGHQYQVNVVMANKAQVFHRGKATTGELPRDAALVSGTIADENGNRLGGVLIRQANSSFIAVSGSDGTFQLPVPDGGNILYFRLGSKKPLDHRISATRASALRLEVRLVAEQPGFRDSQSAATIIVPGE